MICLFQISSFYATLFRLPSIVKESSHKKGLLLIVFFIIIDEMMVVSYVQIDETKRNLCSKILL